MDSITFVILGATGDLTTRKILPAIYHLVNKKKVTKFAIVGAARGKTTFASLIRQAKKFVPRGKSKVWDTIARRAVYSQLDFYDEKQYKALGTAINKLERKFKLPSRRIFYLATLPDHFDNITKNLAKYKIDKHKRGWPKVVYEKPFGHDLKSAKAINSCILRLFEEEHIYRIDHYLGKELVENIAMVRFANRILEPLWNNNHIESIQIVMNEQVDVTNRGTFYDTYGVVKDFVQNHMLQLVALITMDEPRCLKGEKIRDEKVQILKRIVIQDMLLGQYSGYRKTRGVKQHSITPTFAALKLKIKDPRWKNVPIFLKSGKALESKESFIDIKFKPVRCVLPDGCPSETNHFRIQIAPNEGMFLEINNKVPGQEKVQPVRLDFDLCQEFGPNTPQAYETLLEQVLLGNKTAFVRQDGVEYSWKVIDKALKKSWPLYSYKKGSKGPLQLAGWSAKHGVVWQV